MRKLSAVLVRRGAQAARLIRSSSNGSPISVESMTYEDGGPHQLKQRTFPQGLKEGNV